MAPSATWVRSGTKGKMKSMRAVPRTKPSHFTFLRRRKKWSGSTARGLETGSSSKAPASCFSIQQGLPLALQWSRYRRSRRRLRRWWFQTRWSAIRLHFLFGARKCMSWSRRRQAARTLGSWWHKYWNYATWATDSQQSIGYPCGRIYPHCLSSEGQS